MIRMILLLAMMAAVPTFASQLSDNVVRVFAYTNEKGPRPIATAFILNYKSKLAVLTVAHVCNPEADYYLFLEYGTVIHKTDIAALKPSRELCLLTFPPDFPKFTGGIPLATADVQPGDLVITSGFPGAQFKIVAFGNFVGFEPVTVQGSPMDGKALSGIFDYPGIPGQSGSPVTNINQELIGALYAVGPNDSIFVPLADVKKFLDEVIK
jgi:S1-C subfamily serine protease